MLRFYSPTAQAPEGEILTYSNFISYWYSDQTPDVIPSSLSTFPLGSDSNSADNPTDNHNSHASASDSVPASVPTSPPTSAPNTDPSRQSVMDWICEVKAGEMPTPMDED